VAVLTAGRVAVRELTPEDAPFIVTLLNDPAFIRNIGDRGVRTEADAREYLAAGPLASYARHGFGLCAVTLTATGAPIGICGLLQRDELPGPDLGFAFLPEFRSRGFAFEAASAVKADAHARLGIHTLHAIVNPDNEPSIRLLDRLGFSRQGAIRLSGGTADLAVFAASSPTNP
jgi:[ribosomal protein S5]-alanine N-acetyltransferase